MYVRIYLPTHYLHHLFNQQTRFCQSSESFLLRCKARDENNPTGQTVADPAKETDADPVKITTVVPAKESVAAQVQDTVSTTPCSYCFGNV